MVALGGLLFSCERGTPVTLEPFQEFLLHNLSVLLHPLYWLLFECFILVAGIWCGPALRHAALS
jgi:hypothetical protein